MSRFVRPTTTVLRISDGDTLTIKTRLSSGEQRDAYSRMYLTASGELRVNPLQQGLALITAYLVDWSLTDDDGALVPIRGVSIEELESVLNGLDPESFTEIKDAIQAHETATRAAREEEKKRRTGSNGAAATSPSPSGVAGELVGSVN
jgi:hypothetical protein